MASYSPASALRSCTLREHRPLLPGERSPRGGVVRQGFGAEGEAEQSHWGAEQRCWLPPEARLEVARMHTRAVEGDEEEPFCFGSRKGHSNVPQIPFPSTRSVVLENTQTTFKGGLFAPFFFSPLLIFCFLFKEPLRISLMSTYQRCAVCVFLK